jgi:hypothetical protein
MEPLKDEERRRDAELEALCRKITEENPGYFDRLADRIIAEAKAEGGSVPMEELLGMGPDVPSRMPTSKRSLGRRHCERECDLEIVE